MRLLIVSIVLRVRSRSRDERDFQKTAGAWAQSMLRRWFSAPENENKSSS